MSDARTDLDTCEKCGDYRINHVEIAVLYRGEPRLILICWPQEFTFHTAEDKL